MALAYLLCPTFQIENTAGKPATGGWLEVYIAGSREKYYCASDFNGTLHPFRIELDSLGSNIVLADDSNAYDVYAYNRYGGLMMSRYGVKPGAGGGVSAGSITSTDGSIIVTPTANGVDLRVDSELPTSMRCSAGDLQESDTFEFVEEQRNGADASVNNSGQVVVNSGWWHYDVVVRLKWPANPAENTTSDISLHAPNGSSSSYFDRSYSHDETLQLSGEYKCTQDGTVFPVSIQGVPSGMTVELVDFGIHSVTGEGGGGGIYNAGEGIIIDEPNRVISVDTDTIQEKLTAGSNIVIEGTTISATSSDTEIYTVEYTGPIVEGSVFDEAYAAYLAGKMLVVKNGDYTGTLCHYSSAYGLLFAIMQPNLEGSGPTAATEGVVNYMWLYKYGTQSRWGISGLNLLPRSYAADAGKVLMVNPEYPTSHPIWASLPDLSAYVTDTELSTILEGYQTALTAGSNVQINHGVISATDTTYTAGTALSLTGTEFSVKVDGSTVTVNSSGELQAAPAITVDQTYDPTSTNPQSGTAVAEAVAGVDTSLFQAEYGVTPFADIAAAITAKKVVYCKVSPLQNSSRMAFLAYYKLAGNNTDHIEFQYYRSNGDADGADSVFVYDVTRGNVWTTAERTPQKAADWNAEAGTFNSIAHKPDLSVYATTASLGAVAFSNDYDDLDNKPVIPVLPTTKDLVAGSNVTITEGQDTVTIAATDTTYSAGTGISITNNVIACTASFTQQQANWNESDSSSVQYIMNKPTIPTLPATKNLVAGNNLTITEGQDSVTLDVTGIPTIGTVEV